MNRKSRLYKYNREGTQYAESVPDGKIVEVRLGVDLVKAVRVARYGSPRYGQQKEYSSV